MAGFRQNMAQSLGLQVLTFVFFVSIILFGFYAALEINDRNSARQSAMEERGRQFGELLRLDFERLMLKGDDAGVRAKFELLRQNFPAFVVSVADFNENITYSTSASAASGSETGNTQVANMVSGNTPVSDTLSGNAQSAVLIAEKGQRILALALPIENKPECYHCHGWSKPVLGTMLVQYDVEDAMRGYEDANLGRAVVAALLALLLALMIFMFIRQRMLARILNLTATSAAIAAGDFSLEFADSARPVNGNTYRQDELGRLAANLGIISGSFRYLGFARSVLENMSLPGVMCDEQGKVVLINAPLLALLGQTGKSEDYLGLDIESLLYGQSEPTSVFRRMLKAHNHAYDKPELPHLQSMENFVTRQGEKRRVRLDAAAVYALFESGEFLGVFATISDLTEVYQRETVILRQNVNMEQNAALALNLLRELGLESSRLSNKIVSLKACSQEQREALAQGTQGLSNLQAGLAELDRSAVDALKQAEQIREDAADGAGLSRELAASMRRIVENTLLLKEQVQTLGKKLDNTVLIMQAVHDIAAQSNLLAMNIIMEAAKTDDPVATLNKTSAEVSALAGKSMQATQQIGAHVQELRYEVQRGGEMLDNLALHVDDGAKLVLQGEEALQKKMQQAQMVESRIHSFGVALTGQIAGGAQTGKTIEAGRILMLEAEQLAMQAENDIRHIMQACQQLEALLARNGVRVDGSGGTK